MYSRLWQWPARDRHFVGRSIELGRLHGLLDGARRVLLLGPPGLGKRALIGEYGHRFAACYGTYGHALQVCAASAIVAQPPGLAATGLYYIATDEAVPGPAVEASLLAALRALPRAAPACHIVACTASEDLARTVESEGYSVLSLPPLPDEDGLSLIIARSQRHHVDPQERQAAMSLVAAAAGVPATLCRLADRALAQDLPWSECLRRNLI